ncbi:MAG: hypothetical protein MHM6MM_008999 [Cercozoa sp. M6MM]
MEAQLEVPESESGVGDLSQAPQTAEEFFARLRAERETLPSVLSSNQPEQPVAPTRPNPRKRRMREEMQDDDEDEEIPAETIAAPAEKRVRSVLASSANAKLPSKEQRQAIVREFAAARQTSSQRHAALIQAPAVRQRALESVQVTEIDLRQLPMFRADALVGSSQAGAWRRFCQLSEEHQRTNTENDGNRSRIAVLMDHASARSALLALSGALPPPMPRRTRITALRALPKREPWQSLRLTSACLRWLRALLLRIEVPFDADLAFAIRVVCKLAKQTRDQLHEPIREEDVPLLEALNVVAVVIEDFFKQRGL